MKIRGLLMTAVLAAHACFGGPGDETGWAQWRGPLGTGYAPNCNPPTEWSETKNIRWKTEIPGSGHASPIVSGDHVFVSTAVKTGEAEAAGEPPAEPRQGREGREAPEGREGRGGRGGRGRRGGFGGGGPPKDIYEFRVLAIDRATGDIVWSTPVAEMQPHEGGHQTGTFASISPITDGEHIYAFFGSRGLYCLDMDGTVVWEKDLGDMRVRLSFGEGASPALVGDKIVVPWDHEGDSFIAVFDKTSGDEIWRVDRDEGTSWATPLVVNVNGQDQVIMPGTTASIAYDLETGDEIWRCEGLGRNVIPTPVAGHGMVYLMSGFRGSAVIAIELDEAKGNITGTDVIAWTHDRGAPYVPSPMLSGRNLYFLGTNSGILSCFDAVTGEANYAGQRLGDVRNVYSSIVGAGGHVYVCGREGAIAVIEDGAEYKLIATNTLDEGINATPAIVDNEMFVRGDTHLYCIAQGDS